MRTKVFVGNLSFATKENELAKEFEAAGKVISANIITRGPRSLGYGFVELDSESDAENAVRLLNKKEIDGRPINVEVAKPREEGAEGANDLVELPEEVEEEEPEELEVVLVVAEEVSEVEIKTTLTEEIKDFEDDSEEEKALITKMKVKNHPVVKTEEVAEEDSEVAEEDEAVEVLAEVVLDPEEKKDLKKTELLLKPLCSLPIFHSLWTMMVLETF